MTITDSYTGVVRHLLILDIENFVCDSKEKKLTCSQRNLSPVFKGDQYLCILNKTTDNSAEFRFSRIFKDHTAKINRLYLPTDAAIKDFPNLHDWKLIITE